MTESKLQADIIKWLRSKGCFVIKHNAGPGVPAGCPDLSAYYDGGVIFIEVKKNEKSPFQPLQKETLTRLRGWFKYVYVVTPKSWDDIRNELEVNFF
jgi:Holliday junction resolvase